MHEKENVRFSEYVKNRSRRKAWQKVVSALICVVVFCTTYALILPAITQERDTFCGFEEHTHTGDCYLTETAAATEVPEELICQLEEITPHTHDETCWLSVHSHEDACYGQEEVLSCGQEEIPAHSHEGACFETVSTYACGLEVSAGHTHEDACRSEVVKTLSCTLEENEEHTHEDPCYTTSGGELICGLEESAGHSHSEACGTMEVENLVCTTAETEGHTHGEACYTTETVLICTLGEREEPELGCGLEETEGHAHGEDCYAPAQTTASTDPTADPTDPTEEPLTGELICGMEEHTHILICYSDVTADLETAEDWEKTLPETLSGVWITDVLAIADSQMGYQESTLNYEVMEDGETVKGYTRYGEWYGVPYGDWCAMFVSFCLDYAQVEGMPLNSVCQTWIEVLSGEEYGLYFAAGEYVPNPGDLIFFDWDADGISDHVGLVKAVTEATEETPVRITTIEGNSGNRVKENTYDLTDATIMGYARLPVQLTEEEQAQVDRVISLIDNMLSADEIDAKLAEFEEAEDYEGEEAWYTDVCQDVALAYHFYSNLPDELKPFVTNAEKLLELEYIWSVTTLAMVESVDVMQVNSDSAIAPIIVRGGRGTSVWQAGIDAHDSFAYWYAVVVHQENGQYVVKEIYQPGAGIRKEYVYAPYDGFILLVWQDDSSVTDDGFNVSVGDYVSTGGSYFWRHTTEYTGSVLGTVRFFDTPVDHGTPYWSEPTQVTKNIADTSDFIDLNLYDYGSNINYKFKNETYTYNGYSGVTLWPGFQWNGGAYNKDQSFHRHQVDYIDFGNSLITDLQYISSSVSYDYGKASGSVSVGKTYNYNTTSNVPGSTGIINRLWRNGTDWGSLTNRPIGMSMNSTVTTTTEANYDVLKPILSPGGYPVILASDYVSGFDGVLSYLFSENTYADKVNNTTIDGLFQINPTTGEYFFNSRWNHAQYDAGSNTFKLYEEVITPNFIVYPFGNFMPFNEITDGMTSANVKDIEAGTLKNYLAEEVSQKLSYSDSSESQLRTMLSLYRSSLNPDTAGSAWHTYSGLDAIRDYFWGDSGSSDDAPSIHTSDIGELVENGDLYNIDYDVQKNFFFGMDMSMRFYQPKDGLTGNDNGNNASGTWSTVATSIPSYRKSTLYVEEDTQRLSGSPDGIPDYPMKFYFTGDDDVWVYIDGMLFLDLTGIHRHVGGEIDFQKGVVNYYELDVANTGDISKTPYKTYTFTELVTKAIKFKNRNNSLTSAQLTAAVNAIVNPATGRFYDYSIHDFKFFYMERGSGSSVCRINFNFPLLRQNTIAVEKDLTVDQGVLDVLGNPDFKFQVLDVDDNGNKTQNSFFAKDSVDETGNQWAYSLYDADGSVIQEVKVTEKNPDGTVKSLAVYNAEGKIVRKETQDLNGNAVVTNYPENGEVLSIDENGIFTLKAGQRAEFVGIPETWGKYYVRELLDEVDVGQYGTITVSGEAVDRKTVEIGNTSFVGLESPILDMTNGSSTFRFDNKITTEKLAELSITKQLDANDTLSGETAFRMHVEFDGTPIPVGTSYTVDGTAKTVTEAGIIEIAAGETATIGNILSGTGVKIWEDSESAEGYTVSYSQSGSDEWTTDGSSISGVLRVNAAVAVTVKNTEKATDVTIPGTKSMVLSDGKAREFIFNLVEVDADGNVIPGGKEMSAMTSVVGTTEQFGFTITYPAVEFDELPAVRYYKITEEAHADTLANSTVYLAEVTITEAGDSIAAAVTGMWKDGTKIETLSADFTNILTGTLTMTKSVNGSDAGQGFGFTITLESGDSGVDLTAMQFPITGVNADGTPFSAVMNTSFSFTIYANETLTVSGIPYGVKWTITETDPAGYRPGFTVNEGEITDGAESTGTIVLGDTKVDYINTQTYVLPETGGAGTTTYTMAGLALTIGGAVSLMYNKRKRRKGGKFS